MIENIKKILQGDADAKSAIKEAMSSVLRERVKGALEDPEYFKHVPEKQ